MKMKTKASKTWGGPWTVEKLDAFEKYVKAYLTIMNSQKKKYSGWPTTIYFDGFSGSGQKDYNKKDIQEGDIQSLFFENIEQEELMTYKGSPERVLSSDMKFDEYYFVDIDEKAIKELKSRLNRKGLITENCHFIQGDVNQELKKFSEILDEGKASLVFLDPFGMQINWESIEILKGKRVDLWILLPSGVIVNRLLNREGKLRFSKKLEKFFGLPIEEIKEKFYTIEIENTLFGEQERIKKVENSIDKIANIYIDHLKNEKVFDHVTDPPLTLKNSKNVTIYHFIFASNNETAYRIASDIIGKKSKGRKR
jgi:three-Cys-motif partner protein